MKPTVCTGSAVTGTTITLYRICYPSPIADLYKQEVMDLIKGRKFLVCVNIPLVGMLKKLSLGEIRPISFQSQAGAVLVDMRIGTTHTVQYIDRRRS